MLLFQSASERERESESERQRERERDSARDTGTKIDRETVTKQDIFYVGTFGIYVCVAT